MRKTQSCAGRNGSSVLPERMQHKQPSFYMEVLRNLDAVSIAAFADKELRELGLETGDKAPAYWPAPELWAQYEARAVRE